MNKPQIGDQITVGDVANEKQQVLVRVVATFDTLDTDWGDYGHDAMGVEEYIESWDLDRNQEWFAVVEPIHDPLTSWAIIPREVVHG